MYLLLERTQNNMIVAITATKEIQEESGNIYVAEQDCYYCPNTLDLVEVDDIPDYVETGKYCYIESQGFTENPNYRKPIHPQEDFLKALEEIEKLKIENLDLKLAIAEIYEEVTN